VAIEILKAAASTNASEKIERNDIEETIVRADEPFIRFQGSNSAIFNIIARWISTRFGSVTKYYANCALEDINGVRCWTA
jgi:hypothetical protein